MENERNGFEIKITGRIRKSIESSKTADGQRYARFDVTPTDALNGESWASCIAFNTRAELLERFTSRGDVVEISGMLGPIEYIEETGNHVKENNIIMATSIDFPKDINKSNDKLEKTA